MASGCRGAGGPGPGPASTRRGLLRSPGAAAREDADLSPRGRRRHHGLLHRTLLAHLPLRAAAGECPARLRPGSVHRRRGLAPVRGPATRTSCVSAAAGPRRGSPELLPVPTFPAARRGLLALPARRGHAPGRPGLLGARSHSRSRVWGSLRPRRASPSGPEAAALALREQAISPPPGRTPGFGTLGVAAEVIRDLVGPFS